MNEQVSKLRTIGEISREIQVSRARIDYAIQSYGIEPAQRAGIIRLYDDEGVAAIESAVRRISNNRRGTL